jgi:hypothetical protein
LHRTAMAGTGGESIYSRPEGMSSSMSMPVSVVPPVDADPDTTDAELGGTEPILTADELRALLAEQPTVLPEDEGE